MNLLFYLLNHAEITLIADLSMLLTSLFLNANMMAPACSAAFPTIGSRIILIKLTDIPQDSEAAYRDRHIMVTMTYYQKQRTKGFKNDINRLNGYGDSDKDRRSSTK